MTLQEIKDKYLSSSGFEIKRTSDGVVLKIDSSDELRYFFTDGSSALYEMGGYEEVLIADVIPTGMDLQVHLHNFCMNLILSIKAENKTNVDLGIWTEVHKNEMLVNFSVAISLLSIGELTKTRNWLFAFAVNETWMSQERKDKYLKIMNDEITRLGL